MLTGKATIEKVQLKHENKSVTYCISLRPYFCKKKKEWALYDTQCIHHTWKHGLKLRLQFFNFRILVMNGVMTLISFIYIHLLIHTYLSFTSILVLTLSITQSI